MVDSVTGKTEGPLLKYRLLKGISTRLLSSHVLQSIVRVLNAVPWLYYTPFCSFVLPALFLHDRFPPLLKGISTRLLSSHYYSPLWRFLNATPWLYYTPFCSFVLPTYFLHGRFPSSALYGSVSLVLNSFIWPSFSIQPSDVLFYTLVCKPLVSYPYKKELMIYHWLPLTTIQYQ